MSANNTNAPKPAGAKPAVPKINDPEWEKPVAVAKDRNVHSWLVFLGVVCIGIALWTPLRALYYRHGAKQLVRRSVVHDADSFLAIAYYGVSPNALPGSKETSSETFYRHVRALYEHDYTPLSLEDVIAFYKEGKPLPRKGVLMTFEQTRRSSYEETRKVLREFGWKAVMGVNTLPIRQKSAQSLIWPYINEMLMMGNWELADESDQGFTPVEISSSGTKGAFYSNPMWLRDKNRYELPEEFSARIDADHESVIAEFKKETNEKPRAFFFPFGDYGQHDSRAHVIRLANLFSVEKYYDLGFSLGQLALNTRNSDPRCLNRLLVNPEWSGETLLAKLDNFQPKAEAKGLESIAYGPDAWVGEWGDVFTRNDELVMRAIPPMAPFGNLGEANGTTGAKAWLAGSDLIEDGALSIRFQHKRGHFGVYLRTTDKGHYIYLNIDEQGRVNIREKLPNLDEFYLGSDKLPEEQGNGHSLTITLRRNILYARIDGKTLFGGRVLLRGEPEPGLIGLGTWDKMPGVAETIVFDTRLMGRHEGLVTWTPNIANNSVYLSEWLNEHSYEFSVFCPPWLDVYQNAPITFPMWDQSLIRMLAQSNGSYVMPCVEVRDGTLLQKISTEDLLASLQQFDVDGVYLNMAACPPSQFTSLMQWLISLNGGLQTRKMKMILRLPTPIENLSSSGSIIRMLPDVIVAGDYTKPPFELPPERVLGLVSVPAPAGEQTLSLYFQISELAAEKAEISGDVKKEELRQKGYTAFAVGDYGEAISNWTEWAKCDIRNPEPLSLIGDAWVRLKQNGNAIRAYDESLSLNPGNITLAIRRARLLEQMGREEDAATALDTYVRAFPQSIDLIIAQAQWLNRNGHISRAKEVMQKLVAEHPNSIDARLFLQNITEDPHERYQNMKELLAIGRQSETMHFGFGRDIFAAELLAFPESSVFFDFIRDTALHSKNAKTRELYDGFMPITNNISEHFDTGKLSDNWITLGGLKPSSAGRYELRASTDMAEASIRLKHSELMRDGYMEVTLDESVGAFWIYARRSSKAMIRLGYDDEGFLRLQAWQNGAILGYVSTPWLRPPSTIKVRLEVRGDGAYGYVNGKQVFHSPLLLPRDISYGWWAVAPFSTELGTARARISAIECGPLRPSILMMPKQNTGLATESLARIRGLTSEISAISPVAFSQAQDGTVSETPEVDLAPYRMFCNFHRIRLMPMVDIPFFYEIKPEQLLNIINQNQLDGMIVRMRQMPKPEWFEHMQSLLEETSADFILIQQEDSFWPVEDVDGNMTAAQEFERLHKFSPCQLREIPRGSLLIAPLQQTWMVDATPLQEWSKLQKGEARLGNAPKLVISPLNWSKEIDELADKVIARAAEEAKKEELDAKTNLVVKVSQNALPFPATNEVPDAVSFKEPPAGTNGIPVGAPQEATWEKIEPSATQKPSDTPAETKTSAWQKVKGWLHVGGEEK